MSSSIDIYGMQLSAPVRIVQMTAQCLNLPYTFKEVDLLKNEHKTEEFLKLNPMHTIPTVVDGDINLAESRATAGYLVGKHGKDDKLYPKDVLTRYKVDKMLYFDMGVFYKAFGDIVYPKLFGGAAPEQKHWDRLAEVLGWLNGFVAGGEFVAGTNHLTIADISLLATYSTISAAGITDLTKYPEAEAWFKKCADQIPNYASANGDGAQAFGTWFKSK
uniref:Glutathione S-transferase delta-epsilon 2 n=1 Tax=Acartia pacifica TaxID=335913 RepID=A0A0U2T4D0_ACAPC|nr:glutathione S-transferase delta-epsilon 2 [Acartia pacifica]ALS04354.1 glutathione S-transferase delta-epsilon 2 [Acartia pacifica]